MDKHLNVSVMGFPKENYDKELLNKLSDSELSDWALADGGTAIFENMEEFSETVLNNPSAKEQLLSNWWYFLTDMA